MLFRGPLNTQDVIAFTRNLSATLHSGVPLIESLQLFEEKGWRPRQQVIRHVRSIVEAGQSLSDAMATSPYSFPEIAVNLVRAGESEGKLEENLEYVSNYLRNSDDLKRKLQRAMAYPGFVMFTLIGLILAIGIFVLPQILPLFNSLNIELQLSTRVLLRMGMFFQDYGVTFAIGVVVAIIAFLAFIRVKIFRPVWHRCLLCVPYISSIQKRSAISQMGRTMGLLLQAVCLFEMPSKPQPAYLVTGSIRKYL